LRKLLRFRRGRTRPGDDDVMVTRQLSARGYLIRSRTLT
jgi:hypothetical protein